MIPELEALGHRAPGVQREMVARLGVEPAEVAADHAVFTLHPRELAALLAA
ncbi:MAG: hypothetical protein R3C15_14505 [Thermoleophilia bacterium]